MTASTESELIGYLAYIEIAGHGVVGGYLLVNRYARPVQFHCNAPLSATRTQEILYGPTLRTYLYCDQIANSLLEQSQHQAGIILADDRVVLAARPTIDVPIVSILDASNRVHVSAAEVQAFAYDGLQLAVHANYPDDIPAATAKLRELTAGWDFTEPFERIREAIGEAQRAAA